MLLPRALPTLSGYTSITANMGQLDNKGLEATINSVNIKRDNLNWTTSFTFSLNRNKIIHLYGDYVDVLDENGKVIGTKEADDPTNGRYIGHALDEIYGYKVIGIWQEAEAAQALTFGRLPGDYKTQDTDPNGKLEPKDYVWQGNTKPLYRLSMRNNFNIYKAIDVSFLMRANIGQKKAFNYNDSGYSDRVSQMVFPYWTPENKSNEWGRLGFQKTGTIYKDASFLRIDDCSVGYNLPKNLLKRVHVNAARVYFNVDNIGSFDNSEWLIWDPETANPTPCTFSFGLSLSM